MKFAFHGQAPLDLACDLLALPVFDDGLAASDTGKAALAKLGDVLTGAMADERFEGKPGQSLMIHTHGKLKSKRLLLLGCGKLTAFEAETARHLAARTTRAAAAVGAASSAMVAPPGKSDERHFQLYLEGAQLGRYKFGKYLTGDDAKRPDPVEAFTVAGDPAAQEAFGKAVKRATVIATAIGRARDMINEPAGVMTPTRVAEIAQELAKAQGLEIEVLGPAECKKLGMGMFLGVAQGSAQEPRFVHMTYKGKGAKKKVALIGKGVTFDSGGHSLKPSDGMLDMKVDMSGSAAVINAIAAIAELGAPVEVHAYAALTENMLSGSAYKLGDVLISMNGKTVEINNTDAEGRLTLGDAITYALQAKPDEMFDFATLTGACMVALGPHTAGVMSNNDGLAQSWLAAAKATGEDMWQLPLISRLRDQLKSEIADMKNTGERWGGAITAGLFLKEFVGETPWVHVDIAGPATSSKDFGALTAGGVGFAVATMVEYLVPRS